MLLNDRFARFGRSDNQAALAFANRRDHIDDAAGVIFFAAQIAFENQRRIWMQRCEVLKHDFMFLGLRRKTVDLVNLDQREIALAVFRRAHFALNRIAGMQIKAPDLRRADINIIRACQIGSFRRTQKPKPVGQNFKRAIAENGLASARAFFRMANISSCLRRRLALSISKRYAISINCDTCKDFSSDKCIELGREDGGKKIEKENRASARNSE